MRNRRNSILLITGAILFSLHLTCQTDIETTYSITQEGREYFGCAECENLNEEVCEYPLRSRVKQRMELRSCLQFNDRNVIVLQLYLVVGSNGRVLGYRLEDSQQLTVNDQKCLETQISNLIFIENENGVECGAYTLKIMRQNE